MAEKKKTTPAEIDKPIEYEVPMDWQIPDGLVSRYANQMMVVTQEFEYIISFYESKPPILMAKTQEELHEMAKGVKSLPAECVARIIVAKERMPSFVKAFTAHAERTADKNKEAHKNNGEMKGRKQ
jgi:hypothetical protein